VRKESHPSLREAVFCVAELSSDFRSGKRGTCTDGYNGSKADGIVVIVEPRCTARVSVPIGYWVMQLPEMAGRINY
jgi:hypothetical protein